MIKRIRSKQPRGLWLIVSVSQSEKDEAKIVAKAKGLTVSAIIRNLLAHEYQRLTANVINLQEEGE
jgi:hypothetical protein